MQLWDCGRQRSRPQGENHENHRLGLEYLGMDAKQRFVPRNKFKGVRQKKIGQSLCRYMCACARLRTCLCVFVCVCVCEEGGRGRAGGGGHWLSARRPSLSANELNWGFQCANAEMWGWLQSDFLESGNS